MDKPIQLSSSRVVDESTRRKFESDWRSGCPSSIDHYLPDKPPNQYLATLEELVCIEMEFLWSQESKGSSASPDADTLNDVSSRPTFVEDYTRRFRVLREPEIVGRLAQHEAEVRRNSKNPPTESEFRRRFPDLTLSPKLFQSRHGSSHHSSREGRSLRISESDLPRWFGRYQLEAVLGRGGMATVYRASQHKTNRSVAVKIADPISDRLRGDEFRQRFAVEAKAAAGLSHDNIVPVYDVGEINGQPYYTMPVVDGGDLASRLIDGPLACSEAAHRIKDAALGVAAAHAQDILHRDLKPRNLMIDAVTDRTLVTDFGLACEISLGDVGTGDASALHLTRTGQVLGTPPYMAPEQIQDARTADARSDVYALGATLYQTITGRPPFQASTPTETLQQVLQSEVVPPARINESVDRDLETIVLKSLDKQPDKRYATASEFADDLDRYLTGQPIVARRITPVGRVVKWSRRNRHAAVLVAGLIFASLAALGATIGGLVAWGYQSQKTSASLHGALASLDELYTQLSDDPLFSNQPGQNRERQERIRQSIKHYESLVQIAADHPDLQGSLVGTHARLGSLTLAVDGPAKAMEHFQDAFAVFDSLSPQLQATAAAKRAVSDAHNGVGQVLVKQGDYVGAEAAFGRTVAIRKDLASEFAGEVRAERKYANALMNHGLSLARLNRPGESLAKMQKAQSHRVKLLQSDPDNVLLLRDQGIGSFGLGRYFADLGSVSKSSEFLDQAYRSFKNLFVLRPTDGSNLLRLARCRLLQSTIAYESGDVDQGNVFLEEALDRQVMLAAISEHDLNYRMELVRVFQQGGRGFLLQGSIDGARTCIDAVEKLLSHDVAASEEAEQSKDVLRVRLIHQTQKGLLQIAAGESQAGRQELRDALQKWNEVRGRFVNDLELGAEMDDLARMMSEPDA
ncbi:serine/threonine-protein kinase [Planctomycetes bacterium K23_9]|uniref:Serine/threonine-protein kinase PknB n=1 Tax=Stieleria marina TaxID=1930275 RepID=A0A517NMX6_9BACT|nr:Serine/threonine-protein kinase PknB [Planctomycetes bacterium K23_9]